MKKKIPCPYSSPHKSRKAMVDYICSIGGYSSRDGRWPIEFTVGAYDTDFDFDHLWKRYGPESGEGWIPAFYSPEEAVAYYRLAQRLHKEHEPQMWGWGLEDAQRSLQDADTYRMLWDGDTTLDVKLELHGRGGKHLVIAEYEGTDLSSCSEDSLSEYLLPGEDSWDWSFEKVKTFYKYVRQCEVDFTPEKASAEVEYQGAYCFFRNIVNSEWEDERKRIADHNDTVAAAMTLKEAMDAVGMRDTDSISAAFRTLCLSAGITQDEITF